jgi:hypothetical protein
MDRIGDSHLVAARAVGQAAGAAGSDQVECACRCDRANNVIGRRSVAGAVGIHSDDGVVQRGRA